MAELKYSPVKHDHRSFLAKARAREGFSKAYDALEIRYRLAGSRGRRKVAHSI